MKYASCILLLLFWIGVVILLIPRKYDLKSRIEGLKTSELISNNPLRKALKSFRASRLKDIYIKELSESLAYMEHMVILRQGKNISSELLLEELSGITSKLSPCFVSMASHMHLNEKKAAATCLYEYIGESYASDIGRLLSEWEDLNSTDLASSIESYGSALREDRETRLRRKDEVISDLIYFPVILNCMIIFINFIYVGFFIQQKDMFSIFF